MFIGAGAVYPYSDQLMEYLERETRYDEKYSMGRLFGPNGQKIIAPRNMAGKYKQDFRVDGLPYKFKSTFVPRHDEQARVVSETVALLRKGRSFMVESPTGSGKTYMATDIIAQMGVKTIVVVTKEDIRDQWVAAITTTLGLALGKGIGLIQGDTVITAGQGIVIAMVQSLAKEARYPEHIFHEFGLMIVDETHRIAADYFSQACYRVPAKLRIGISATPDRKDGREEVLYAHIGPVLVKSEAAPMKPRVLTQQSPWEIPMTRQKQKDGTVKMVQIPHSAGRCGHITSLICNHHPRNSMIANFVGAAYKKGRIILVQSDRLGHLEVLASMISSKGVPPGEIAYYVGGMTSSQREVSKGKRIIMATYAMTCVHQDQRMVNPLTGEEFKFSDVQCGGVLDGAGELAENTSFLSGGVKDCVRLEANHGPFVVSTDHQILTPEGWRTAGGLLVGGYVCSPVIQSCPIVDIKELSDDDLWLLGAFLGDGCLVQKGTAYFTTADAELSTEANRILLQHGMFLNPPRYKNNPYDWRAQSLRGKEYHSKKYPMWLMQVFSRFDMRKKAAQKRIPVEFMQLPDSKIGNLLAGLMDTDGSVSARGEVTYTSCSKELVHQVSFLFRRLGVSVTEPAFSSSVWKIALVKAAIKQFKEVVPMRLTRKKDRVEAFSLLSFDDSAYEFFPVSEVNRIKSEVLASGALLKDMYTLLRQNGYSSSWLSMTKKAPVYPLLYLCKVLGIAPPETKVVKLRKVEVVGPLPVGDITVQSTHSFVCSGVVVHNSEATDIPWLDTLVMATPKSDVRQIVGRILRTHEGKQEPLVFDILDTSSSVFRGYSVSRKRWYESIGAKVVSASVT